MKTLENMKAIEKALLAEVEKLSSCFPKDRRVIEEHYSYFVHEHRKEFEKVMLFLSESFQFSAKYFEEASEGLIDHCKMLQIFEKEFERYTTVGKDGKLYIEFRNIIKEYRNANIDKLNELYLDCIKKTTKIGNDYVKSVALRFRICVIDQRKVGRSTNRS